MLPEDPTDGGNTPLQEKVIEKIPEVSNLDVKVPETIVTEPKQLEKKREYHKKNGVKYGRPSKETKKIVKVSKPVKVTESKKVLPKLEKIEPEKKSNALLYVVFAAGALAASFGIWWLYQKIKMKLAENEHQRLLKEILDQNSKDIDNKNIKSSNDQFLENK